MSRPIVLKASHNQSVEATKERITERVEALRETWMDKLSSATFGWTGDTAHVSAKALGQAATAEIAVLEHQIIISIHLPMILRPFAGAIEKFLESNADVLQSGTKTS